MTHHSETNRETGRISRRTFLARGSAGLAGAGLALGGSAGAQDAPKCSVVRVTHPGATDDNGVGQLGTVRQMVDRAVCTLSDTDDLAAAWGKFVSPDDVVGIKVNVRAGAQLSVQPCVVDAVVVGLEAAGVKKNNIIVWDAWSHELPRAGYPLNDSTEGVRCYGTDKGQYKEEDRRAEREARKKLAACFQEKTYPVGDQTVQFSKILAEEVTALINIPMVKDHRIAGVTCSMKNHYGSIRNPSDLHENCCDPYLAELNAAAPIRDKTRLIVVDGLRGLYNGGPYDKPQWRWQPNCVLAGTDPVAVDTLAMRILDEKRQEVGMEPIGDKARHIATAAKLGLGTNDLEQAGLREIDLG